MTEVRTAGAVIEGDERGVDGVGFARVHHALALGGGLHPDGAHEEGVLQMGEELMQCVFGHGHALRGEEVVDLLHAEGTASIRQQMAHEEAQRGDVRYLMPLHHIPQQRHIDVALQQARACLAVICLFMRDKFLAISLFKRDQFDHAASAAKGGMLRSHQPAEFG